VTYLEKIITVLVVAAVFMSFWWYSHGRKKCLRWIYLAVVLSFSLTILHAANTYTKLPHTSNLLHVWKWK